jgi:predicted nucleic acid-binding protein
MAADALLDSNIVVVLIASRHQHHEPSRALFELNPRQSFAIAAHSFAEAYVTLTRSGRAGLFEFQSREAWAALDRLRSRITLVGLTAAQNLDALRSYAESGGIGARFYDAMIGQTAVMHAIPTIMTWNTPHMRGLFPALDIATPAEYLTR